MDDTNIKNEAWNSEVFESTFPKDQTIERLRRRAWLLRIQAFCGLFAIISLAMTLIYTFSNQGLDRFEIFESKYKARDPFDYKLMEARHTKLSETIRELIDEMIELKQDVKNSKFAPSAKTTILADLLNSRIEDLRKTKGHFYKSRSFSYESLV